MINRAILVGRLTKDIELRKTQSNLSVAQFTLAVDKRIKPKDGKDTAYFINCVAWRQSADFLAKYAKKGSIVGVEGEITTRSYDGQNGKVYVTEVTCDSVRLIGGRREESEPEPEYFDPVVEPREEPEAQQTGLGIDASDLPWF